MKLTILLIAATLLAATNAAPNPSEKAREWSEDIETWEPSAAMSRDCPYYHAGYDFEGRPVMIAEFGKWPSLKYASMGDDKLHEYEKYMEKFWWRITQLEGIDSDAEDGVIVIYDFAGFDNKQLRTPHLFEVLILTGRYSSWAEPQVAELLLINVSHAVVVFENVFASVSGRLAGRMEAMSGHKEVWQTQLLNKIPADQLPPWYGGKVGFKPVKVFGQ